MHVYTNSHINWPLHIILREYVCSSQSFKELEEELSTKSTSCYELNFTITYHIYV